MEQKRDKSRARSPWLQGYEKGRQVYCTFAYFEPRQECPYDKGTEGFAEWHRGFDDAVKPSHSARLSDALDAERDRATRAAEGYQP